MADDKPDAPASFCLVCGAPAPCAPHTFTAAEGGVGKWGDGQNTRPFKELADAMSPESRARADAKAAVLSQTTARDAIADCLQMGRGMYPSPEDWAEAVLKRLAHEGFAVVRVTG